MRDCEPTANAGAFSGGPSGLDGAAKEAEWARQREEQEMTGALHTLMRADQFRQDKAFMERLRVWIRSKRAELDGQLDRIGA